jgi:hypothetical protein
MSCVPFVQRLTHYADKGDVGAVRTLLIGSAESVADFINWRVEVRLIHALMLILPLLPHLPLLLLVQLLLRPSDPFP